MLGLFICDPMGPFILLPMLLFILVLFIWPVAMLPLFIWPVGMLPLFMLRGPIWLF